MSSDGNAGSFGRIARELLRELREPLAQLVPLLFLVNLSEFLFEALDRLGIEELLEQSEQTVRVDLQQLCVERMVEHETVRLQLSLQPILGERVFDHDVNPVPVYIQCSAVQRDQQARQRLIF